jgi:hypothetical protein
LLDLVHGIGCSFLLSGKKGNGRKGRRHHVAIEWEVPLVRILKFLALNLAPEAGYSGGFPQLLQAVLLYNKIGNYYFLMQYSQSTVCFALFS